MKEDNFNFWREMFNDFKLRKVDSDNYEILLGSTVIIKLINCYYVSDDFIKDIFKTQREFFLQEDYKGEVKEIDAWELLDETIRENEWDWKKEVAVYKGEAEKSCFNLK